uniref:Uncharacterized protein n=1 Tax=viral metagenome TaxID=1070528 RepID=A0A6M3JHN8_9ZZZZ
MKRKMKIKWDEDGDLNILFDGCFDCGGEQVYLTPEEVDELLAKRPKTKEVSHADRKEGL